MARIFVWDDKYLTGIEIIDLQHKSFVEVLNRVYDILQGERNPEALKAALKGVVTYAHEHFDTEEAIMLNNGFPGYTDHKAVHQAFREIANDLAIKIEQKDFKMDFALLDYLEDWLENHLQTEDRKYTIYFKENGITG